MIVSYFCRGLSKFIVTFTFTIEFALISELDPKCVVNNSFRVQQTEEGNGPEELPGPGLVALPVH